MRIKAKFNAYKPHIIWLFLLIAAIVIFVIITVNLKWLFTPAAISVYWGLILLLFFLPLVLLVCIIVIKKHPGVYLFCWKILFILMYGQVNCAFEACLTQIKFDNLNKLVTILKKMTHEVKLLENGDMNSFVYGGFLYYFERNLDGTVYMGLHQVSFPYWMLKHSVGDICYIVNECIQVLMPAEQHFQFNFFFNHKKFMDLFFKKIAQQNNITYSITGCHKGDTNKKNIVEITNCYMTVKGNSLEDARGLIFNYLP
ncbi:MAG: hypothetical protein GX996_02510 [Firmicutes bacterium]|nr:hypothetical protein [Bacillota bacterium]